jgi:AcrR family transcriptional regulator
MRPDRQSSRRREIEKAAYEVLAENGYRATSMLAIAKRAGASNETLYNWYGSKQALFRSMVEENAREVAELLRKSIADNRDPLGTLRSVGPVLLRLLTSERAIALNRAAVTDADETGILGQTLAEAGRESIMPLIARVFEEARLGGQMIFTTKEEPAEIYLGVLVGDLQIRRAIGVLGPLQEAAIRRRAELAVQVVQNIFRKSRSERQHREAFSSNKP